MKRYVTYVTTSLVVARTSQVQAGLLAQTYVRTYEHTHLTRLLDSTQAGGAGAMRNGHHLAACASRIGCPNDQSTAGLEQRL